ncbi:N-acetylglucosamine-6-phosphate deacetylase [Brachyspira sp.]|uniref:N-acetylglucosamine-6-phosphate deacetylase n=1 Tax=Brachyspira sp. TaxID=1977261 RepID=UPI003D7E4EFD
MRIIITEESVYEWAAYYTAKCILDYSDKNKPFVLSFPARYIDKSYYQKLLSFYNDNIISFKNIHIVSSGEYIDSNISQKYLEDNFLRFIDLPKENIHFFDSFVSDRKKEANRMENLIKDLGGITLLIDALAEDGSFLLNTPSSSLDGSVRDKRISEIIRSYEAKKIGITAESFPKEGFTLGFEEAFDSKYIMIIAKGYEVSEALSHCVEGEISQFYPASVLQKHKKLIIVADEEASENLKVKTYKYAKSLESKSLYPKELIKGLYKSYYALTNIKIFDGEKFIKGYCIVIENNIIKSVEKEIDVDAVITRIDLGGKIVAPGYIDLQVNGIGGYDINLTPTIETLQNMSEVCQRYGCTSYLPTIITTDDNHMLKVIDLFNNIEDLSILGVLGIHFEGPYISHEKRGIHEDKFIRHPNKEMIDKINDSKCVMITVAPETVDGKIIESFAKAGKVVSAGHTNATYNEIKEKIPYGITFATHLFNAMRPWGSREPGAVGAVLETKNIYAGLICDGVHCDFASVELAYKLKQGHICIVTDAIPPAAAPDIKEYMWAGSKLHREGNRLIDDNGTLGGSSITMSQSVRNVVNQVGATLEEALKMASLYPAQVMKIDNRYGRIKEGYIADLVILDEKLIVKGVVFKGNYKEYNFDYEWETHA